jgi:hypothetical protein
MIGGHRNAGCGLPLRVVRNGSEAHDQDLNRHNDCREQPE